MKHNPEILFHVRCDENGCTLKKRGKTLTRRIPIPDFLVRELPCLADGQSDLLWPFSSLAKGSSGFIMGKG